MESKIGTAEDDVLSLSLLSLSSLSLSLPPMIHLGTLAFFFFQKQFVPPTRVLVVRQKKKTSIRLPCKNIWESETTFFCMFEMRGEKLPIISNFSLLDDGGKSIIHFMLLHHPLLQEEKKIIFSKKKNPTTYDSIWETPPPPPPAFFPPHHFTKAGGGRGEEFSTARFRNVLCPTCKIKQKKPPHDSGTINSCSRLGFVLRFFLLWYYYHNTITIQCT